MHDIKHTSSSSSSSSGPSSSDDKELSDDELVARLAIDNNELRNEHKRARTAHHGSLTLFIHKRWHTLHAQHKDDVLKLACGRIIGGTYVKIGSDHSFSYVRCKYCFT